MIILMLLYMVYLWQIIFRITRFRSYILVEPCEFSIFLCVVEIPIFYANHSKTREYVCTNFICLWGRHICLIATKIYFNSRCVYSLTTVLHYLWTWQRISQSFGPRQLVIFMEVRNLTVALVMINRPRIWRKSHNSVN